MFYIISGGSVQSRYDFSRAEEVVRQCRARMLQGWICRLLTVDAYSRHSRITWGSLVLIADFPWWILPICCSVFAPRR